MTTAALAKIKCPEELSWATLAKVCRLCLRNECIQFDIFEEEDSGPTDPLHRRIVQFYGIQVRWQLNYCAIVHLLCPFPGHPERYVADENLP